ncbi:MAG: M28 family peptidase [Acholeplasmatales bacterium]|jgi:glutamyl aminopeptidase|nr:M28 family peptidase [Acholeplasmatales bacterium]
MKLPSYYRDLHLLYGVSSKEKMVRDYIKKFVQKNPLLSTNYEYFADNIGGFGYRKLANQNQAKVICFAAHLDEVGFLVEKINPNGTLELLKIGGLTNETIISQAVTLINQSNRQFSGLIASIPPHLKSVASNEKIICDLGMQDNIEVIKAGIKVGDFVTFAANYQQLTTNRVLAKSVDDRLGCACLLDLMQSLAKATLAVELVFYFTVLEEVGTRGAEVLGNIVSCDYFLAIDCSPLLDYLSNNHEEPTLGAGFLLRLHDPVNILDQDFKNYLINLAAKKKIPYQQYFAKGSTDAAKMLISQNGVKATTLGIGARYIHSNAAIFDIRDVKSVLKMSKVIVESFSSAANPKTLQS